MTVSPLLLILLNFQEELNKFLIIKAKYYVVEPYYMEGFTPDGLVVFSGSSNFVKIIQSKN
jgi:hypothetical protein